MSAANRIPAPPSPLTGLSRRFGDLKVRPKLMVLHNLFYIVLSAGVYSSVVPLVETRLAQARDREVSLIVRSLRSITGEAGEEELKPYDLRTGTADDFGLSEDARRSLEQHPDDVWRRDSSAEHLYRQVPGSNRFYRLTLPLQFFAGLLRSVRLALFLVLGVVYVFAVLLLELLIMPRYVYRPLQLLLDADEAARAGQRNAEIISETLILADELGQIMRSHNETLRKLRAHEDELEDARRNLEAQDRLASLGQLSASVAHEMNTPLSVLHGSVEKLRETIKDEEAQKRLERIHRATGRLIKISRGLLDFARPSSLDMQPVELRPLVEEAWHLVAIDEKANEVRFENAVNPHHKVVGNSDRLVQVFVNLLRNSLIAVPPAAGTIWVSSQARTIDSRPAVAIAVEDNGPGIPVELLSQIFEAFVSSRLDARGTGLGLTVAQGIVGQHAGTITASNRPEGGARLELVLPAPREVEQ